jgi:hypothetical protein
MIQRALATIGPIVLALVASDAFACRGLGFETKVFLDAFPPKLERFARYEGRMAIFKARVIKLMPISGPDRRGSFSARIEVSEVLQGQLRTGTHTLTAPNSSCDHPLDASMAGYVAGILGTDDTIEALSYSNYELSGQFPKAR